MKKIGGLFWGVALFASLVFVNVAQAILVNGDGFLTSEVIFGSGNANGSWTGENIGGIEVGLRGKLRYNLGGLPENTFNYDGDRTYSFDPATGNPPANRSIFNFEFSVNVNSNDSTGNVLSDFSYLLQVDADPSAGTSFISFDPVTGFFAIPDNATGTNATANGAGIETPATYAARLLTDSVAQNSQNRGFGFFSGGLDPQLEGIYTYNLLVLSNSVVLASTSIDIVVGSLAVVPLPAALPLYGTGLALMGFIGWRRRKAATA